MPRIWRGAGAFLLLASGFVPVRAGSGPYDPLARARADASDASEARANAPRAEYQIPPQCYARTEGGANSCHACHSEGQPPNHVSDWELQREYAFSELAQRNPWGNFFRDRSAARAAFSATDMERWRDEDNYSPLRHALGEHADYPGYRPDLDLHAGFDPEGFARDGSGWRAFRYKPLPGGFWPTNGSSADAYLRLPRAFRVDEKGEPSRAHERLNHALLEAAIAAPPGPLARSVEPIDEGLASFDLDGDGKIAGRIQTIRQLPRHFAGGARKVRLLRHLYPRGTEFLHTLRYLDLEAPGLLSRRLKELRYARKERWLDPWALLHRAAEEHEEKDEGHPPFWPGTALTGLANDSGWQYQGFIEDARGRLRLQTIDEHRYCMGCHGGLSVTVDSSFSFARKLPGTAGWLRQSLEGQRDLRTWRQKLPEYARWLERVGGGDAFRSNEELAARFFPGGRLWSERLARLASGGDRDLRDLIVPSAARALELDRAYRVTVEEQSFLLGREVVLSPPARIYRRVRQPNTRLLPDEIHRDTWLWLDEGPNATDTRRP